jgi:uncharacterized protein YukE
MAKIAINSNEAMADKDDLSKCRAALNDAKSRLTVMRSTITENWNGSSAAQCLSLIDGFIKQIDDLMSKSTLTQSLLDTIVRTYQDADSRLSGRFNSL